MAPTTVKQPSLLRGGLAAGVMACAAVGLARAQEASAFDPPSPGHMDVQWATELASGRYGAKAVTRDLQHTLTLRRRWREWVASVELPWIRSRTAGEGLQPPARAEGLGDAWLKLTHPVWQGQASHAGGLDGTLKLKTRTGSASQGLGSGGTDVALQLEAWRPTASGLQWFGLIGHRLTGGTTGSSDRKNPWYLELGAQKTVQAGFDVGAYAHVRQAIGSLGGTREWTTYGAWRRDGTRTQVYLTRGYAQASPDWAGGLVLRQRF